LAPIFEPKAGGDGPFLDIGLQQIFKVPFRPIGKSGFKRPPWADVMVDDYIPCQMSASVLKTGLAKAKDNVLPIDENLVLRAEKYMINKMKSVWTLSEEEFIMTYEDALLELTLDKSPGFPYFYDCIDKKQALEKYGPEIKERVQCLLRGDPVECVFAMTEKSELRLKSKVEEGKTRVFCASDIHHLLASKMLMDKQNEMLMDKIGQHPITLGIQLPGPGFIRAVVGLGKQMNDGDISGCDLRFHPRLARVIRNVRKSFIPSRYHQAMDTLYSSVYAGGAVGVGGLYRLYGNKSGWENTSSDNSFMTWLSLIIASFTMYVDLDPDVVFNALINGDDLLVSMLKGDFETMCGICRTWGVFIEADDWQPRDALSVVFLSHHLQQRYVQGFGDFVVAAGNLPKLLSSLHWVKSTPTLTFEESCLAHLLGLRICLFPWAVHFDDCDELLTNYLKTLDVLTPFMKQCLSARLTQKELAYLHTKCENFFFDSQYLCSYDLVLKGKYRQIKDKFRNDQNQNSKTKGESPKTIGEKSTASGSR
jgi:hypothetical protein